MLHPTPIIAAIVVLIHCAVLFWPRRPLKAAVDKDGMPILWCNETDAAKNVACVWPTDIEDVVAHAHAGPQRKSA